MLMGRGRVEAGCTVEPLGGAEAEAAAAAIPVPVLMPVPVLVHSPNSNTTPVNSKSRILMGLLHVALLWLL